MKIVDFKPKNNWCAGKRFHKMHNNDVERQQLCTLMQLHLSFTHGAQNWIWNLCYASLLINFIFYLLIFCFIFLFCLTIVAAICCWFVPNAMSSAHWAHEKAISNPKFNPKIENVHPYALLSFFMFEWLIQYESIIRRSVHLW